MQGFANGIFWIAAGTPDPDRPSLLFIPGAGANSAAWWQQFGAFSQAHHCIAYDLAGFGESKPAAGKDLRAEMVAAAAGVLAAAGARRAHVVCQSLGGWTGLRLALDRPEHVVRLVLSGTLAGIAHAPGLAAFQQAFEKMDERGPASLGLSEEFEAAHPLKASLYRQLDAVKQQHDPALAQRLFAPAFLVSPSQLAQIAAPTLMLTGSDDRIWPPESLEGLSAHFAKREVHSDREIGAVALFRASGSVQSSACRFCRINPSHSALARSIVYGFSVSDTTTGCGTNFCSGVRRSSKATADQLALATHSLGAVSWLVALHSDQRRPDRVLD